MYPTSTNTNEPMWTDPYFAPSQPLDCSLGTGQPPSALSDYGSDSTTSGWGWPDPYRSSIPSDAFLDPPPTSPAVPPQPQCQLPHTTLSTQPVPAERCHPAIEQRQPRHRSLSISHTQRARTASLPEPSSPTSPASVKGGAAPDSAKSNNLGWVHCHPSSGKLVTSGNGVDAINSGRKARGRKKPLTPEQKSKAAMMRIVKACENCRRRKERCDPGTPCKSCVDHFRTDLVRHPCRGKVSEDLSGSPASNRRSDFSGSSVMPSWEAFESDRWRLR
ncbi:hypothetical protein K490DRAFT_69062 [Saccharata proteae CBS 121410]|uniref:Zn(2)-C6 fungal-type domain-containing protein n=1 Tax=Saccharata proteae CBS 121410 TaxID=1314787 RepID=A0A9P4HP64_9PEZI|nr:hypothetical protein K490DRAFT_69062 [Saccharata proteae CBS 121410]